MFDHPYCVMAKEDGVRACCNSRFFMFRWPKELTGRVSISIYHKRGG